MRHELKSWPEFFVPVLGGTKTFEIRKNDRKFQIGDTLILREWNPQLVDPFCGKHHFLESDGCCTCGSGEYTGRTLEVQVTYMTNFRQQDDHVVMSVVLITKVPDVAA